MAAHITSTDQRARALSQLAMTLMGTIGNTSSTREAARCGSPVLNPVRRLLAEALVIGSWVNVIVSLAHVEPTAISRLASDLQVRWGFDA